MQSPPLAGRGAGVGTTAGALEGVLQSRLCGLPAWQHIRERFECVALVLYSREAASRTRLQPWTLVSTAQSGRPDQWANWWDVCVCVLQESFCHYCDTGTISREAASRTRLQPWTNRWECRRRPPTAAGARAVQHAGLFRSFILQIQAGVFHSQVVVYLFRSGRGQSLRLDQRADQSDCLPACLPASPPHCGCVTDGLRR